MTPLPFRWTGDSLTPLKPRLADAEYVIGAVYWMEPEQVRSDATHRHQFAWLREAWSQLPEKTAEQFPTPEHLRKRVLIDAGFYAETIIDAGTNAAALRVAAFVRHKDEFSHVVVRGPLVVERVAKSQSRRAMDAREFQASKTAVLEIVAGLIGVAPEQLERNAGQAA